MATLKPHLIRADTLDLQDHTAPSAQNHVHHPQFDPAAGEHGAHQQEELRHVSAERNAEQEHMADAWGSGRSSHEGSELLDQDEARLDEKGMQSGKGKEEEEDDEEDEDEDDKDVMDDRMSSSPSIDDNGSYTFSSTDPARCSSVATKISFFEAKAASCGTPKRSSSMYRPVQQRREEIGIAVTTEEPDFGEAQVDGSNDGWNLFEPERDSTAFHRSTSSPYIYAVRKSNLMSTLDLHWPLVAGPMAGLEEEDSGIDSSSVSLLGLSRTSISSDMSLVNVFQHLGHEDIDPDFVYALHNFVATVDGQANAAKGDAMVLLDDSNSYWWLVKLVKDSTIGYLPAEHIELPVEREARQNKHRNLELSRTMLHDDPGKSKNPLKKAMRRRNMKRVVFPNDGERDIYYEPSEHEWSDEEPETEQEAMNELRSQAEQQNGSAQNGVSDAQRSDGEGVNDAEQSSNLATITETSEAERMGIDAERAEDSEVDSQDSQRTSKAGTIRNTDSFFGDDSEPRKISLTPNILRDESAESSVRSSGSLDKAPNSAELMEQTEKPAGTEKTKEESKKRKEKKPGMLSGLFKRKDKKIKVDEAPGGTLVKHEAEPGSPVSVTDTTSSLGGPTSPLIPSPLQTKRPTGKLTKAPPVSSGSQANGPARSAGSEPLSPRAQALDDESEPSNVASTASASASGGTKSVQPPQQSSTGQKGSMPTSIDTTIASSSKSAGTVELISNASKQTSNVESAGGDRNTTPASVVAPASSATTAPYNTPTQDNRTGQSEVTQRSPTPQRVNLSQQPQHSPSLSNSSTSSTVSPITPSEDTNDFLSGDRIISQQQQYGQTNHSQTPRDPTSAISETSNYLRSPSNPTPLSSQNSNYLRSPNDLASATSETSHYSTMTPQFQTPLEKPVHNQWNESAFQTYLDQRSAQDTRDMLLIVHDKTGVTPFPLDHPTMLGFGFHEHQKRLDEMQRNLDQMLQGFLARKAARPRLAPTSQQQR